jgi:hypothetical protein
MAIKLTGVDGPKLLAEEAQAKTQDFVMINSPAFFIRNASDYVSFARASKYHVPFAFFLTHWHELRVARAIVEEKAGEVFEQRYFSMTPYLLGQRYIKFSARPVDCGTGAALVPSVASPPGGPDHLRDRMIAWMSSRTPASLSPSSRKRSGDHAREDQRSSGTRSRRRSSKSRPSGFQAAVRFEAQQTFCENLSYTPCTLLRASSRGRDQSIRKVVYERISVLRHKLNKTPRVEPTGNETFN